MMMDHCQDLTVIMYDVMMKVHQRKIVIMDHCPNSMDQCHHQDQNLTNSTMIHGMHLTSPHIAATASRSVTYLPTPSSILVCMRMTGMTPPVLTSTV
jgi:hypothetical protein